MIAVAPPMIISATLLIFSAFALVDHPVLTVLDIFVALYLLWNSITRIDPPGGGKRSRLYDPIPAPSE